MKNCKDIQGFSKPFITERAACYGITVNSTQTELVLFNVLEWHLIFAILFTLPSLIFIFPKQILNFKMRSRKTKEHNNNDFNEYSNTTNKQTMNRFKTKSQNNEVIDGDYEVINENKKNKP